MTSKLCTALVSIGAFFSSNALSVVKTTEKFTSDKLGRYEFGVAAEKPTGIGEYNHYETMYNDPDWGLKLQAAYYPIDFTYFALGGRMSAGHFRDNGKPVTGVTPPYEQDLTEDMIDPGQKTFISTTPIDVGADIRVSPFLRRWMYFNVWANIGTAFVQESLSVNTDAGDANSETLSSYVNKGWITNWKYGFSIAFNVTQIDRSTITSIRNYGVSGVYFRPYYERTTTIKSNLGNFDQEAYGIAFDFVSLY